MELYIPTHLRKIKVIDQLYSLYSEYVKGVDENGNAYYVPSSNPFESYQSYIVTDPVKRFIENWINEDKLGEMDKDIVVSYLTKLFYSLKGTTKALDCLKTYLGLDFTYNYSISFLELNISAETSDININDAELFESDLLSFCSELLYFCNDKSSIDKIKINVAEKVENNVGAYIIPYRYWSAEE